MTDPLPPISPRPPRLPEGELPPLGPRPAQPAPTERLPRIEGGGSEERTNELPRVERPAAATPKRDLRTGREYRPPEPTPIRPAARGRGGRTAIIASGVILVAAAAGAVSARIAGPDGEATPVSASRSTPVASSGTALKLEDAVRRSAPSVVEVRTPFGQGSGVIVQPEGLIVTNDHVVNGASRVEVVTASGGSLAAEVLETDEFQDLAVLRPAGNPGPGVDLAQDSSGPPAIGQAVFAIGSPFGFQNTVTAGVVSAFRDDGGRPLIQFDAPVNPGNSGGGLFDLKGELIGIPTSIQSPIPGNVGLAFAVPASRVRAMLDRVS